MLKKYLTSKNIFISISLFILTVGQFIPVEIENDFFRFIVYILILILLPISLYEKLKIVFIRLINPYLKALIGLLVFCIIGFYWLHFLLFGIGETMCSCATAKTLYVRQGFSFSTIIVRDFDCSAFYNGTPKYEIVNRIDIFSLIQIVPSIDTSSINKNNWIRVEAKYK